MHRKSWKPLWNMSMRCACLIDEMLDYQDSQIIGPWIKGIFLQLNLTFAFIVTVMDCGIHMKCVLWTHVHTLYEVLFISWQVQT